MSTALSLALSLSYTCSNFILQQQHVHVILAAIVISVLELPDALISPLPMEPSVHGSEAQLKRKEGE